MTMNKLLMILSLVLGCWGASAQAKSLTILVDASASNPMLINTAFNRRATEHVIEQITALKRGDSVTMQTFGSLQSADNFKKHKLAITRHNRKKVAASFAKQLLALPKAIKPQGSTNIIAWFNRNQVNCDKGGQILLLSDAIEASEYISPNDLLSGQKELPAPSEFVNVRGCEVILFGIGAGRSDSETTRLRKAWASYFDKAGASLTAIPL